MLYSNCYEYRDIARLPPEEQYRIDNELEVLVLIEQRDQYEQHENCYIELSTYEDNCIKKLRKNIVDLIILVKNKNPYFHIEHRKN